MSIPTKKIRIGDLLVQNNIISEEQLVAALKNQKESGKKLGQSLQDLGFIEQDQLLNFLSKQLNIPLINLDRYQFDPHTVRIIPETTARRFRCVALENTSGGLLVGMADPLDLFALGEIERLSQSTVKQAVVKENDLLETLDLVYRRTDEISNLAEQLGDELGEADDFDFGTLSDAGDDQDSAPVVRLIKSIFEDAIQVRASDIHIEPDQDVLRIRQRVDGELQEHVMKERHIAAALVLRLKLLSGLNISEKRLPQDGRFNIKVKGRNIDVRISTMPVQFGESVVMRLLDQSQGLTSLDNVGLPKKLLERLRRLIHLPHGLILVTGPTGSGKTTTLYGALQELNSPGRKIITAEDPVEYRLPRINQVGVMPKIGLDFGTVLKACLRQDPDILLVGEIRDQETADIALRAALTGHLVLSTLHTNDAITSAMRLIDVGVEGYVAAAALKAVVAQRLVQRVCTHCKEPVKLTEQHQRWLSGMVNAERLQTFQFVHGRGCNHCNNSGHSGRIGVFELLEIDDNMRNALRENSTAKFTLAARKSPYFRPLAKGALEYAVRGITTVEEVFRISELVAS